MIIDRHPETGRLVILRAIPPRHVARAFGCLALLLRSGVGILRALHILEEQEPHPVFKRVLLGLRTWITAGASLSQTMGIHPLAFNRMQTAMVAAGETHGRLPDMLDRLSRSIEKDQQLVSRLRAAALYPMVVLTISVAVLLLVSQTLLRTATPMLAASGQSLPGATRALLFATSPLGLLGTGVLILVTGILLQMFVLTQAGQLWLSLISLRIPLLGPCLLKIELSRILRSLASLYEAGVPIQHGFDVVAGLTRNTVIQRQVQQVSVSVQQGSTLAEAFGQVPGFPTVVRQFAEVGESSGQLGTMLLRMSQFFDMDVEHAIELLMAALEPALIATMGVAVGFVVVVGFAPLYQLMSRVAL